MGSSTVIKIDDALTGVVRLGLDTAPVIYFNPSYDELVTEIFQRVSQGALTGVTSVITLSEVLVQPMRRQNLPLQQEYRDLLLASRNLQSWEVSAAIAESAAALRVRYRLRTPDALQIATALEAGCQALLCNDTELRRISELRVLVLDDLEL